MHGYITDHTETFQKDTETFQKGTETFQFEIFKRSAETQTRLENSDDFNHFALQVGGARVLRAARQRPSVGGVRIPTDGQPIHKGLPADW